MPNFSPHVRLFFLAQIVLRSRSERIFNVAEALRWGCNISKISVLSLPGGFRSAELLTFGLLLSGGGGKKCKVFPIVRSLQKAPTVLHSCSEESSTSQQRCAAVMLCPYNISVAFSTRSKIKERSKCIIWLKGARVTYSLSFSTDTLPTPQNL